MLVVFDRYGSYICFGSNNTNQRLVLQHKMQHFQGTNTLANVTSKNCQVQKPEAPKVQEWALEPFAGGKIPRQIFRRHHFLYLPKLCSCQCSIALLLSHCSLPLRSWGLQVAPPTDPRGLPRAMAQERSVLAGDGFNGPASQWDKRRWKKPAWSHFDNVAGIWVDLAWCSHVCTCSLVT